MNYCWRMTQRVKFPGQRKETFFCHHACTGMRSRSIVFPLPKSCWRFGEMEEPPSGGNVLQATQASPDDLDTRFAITLAPQETSQASNPVDGLVQGRRLLWGGRRLMNGGIQRLPFLLLQQHLTTGLGCLSRFIGEP